MVPELDRPRDLGDLLTVSFNLFVRNFSPLFSLAMIPVIPYVILIDGVWGRSLADGADTKTEPGPTAAYLVVGALIVQPLVTALVVRFLDGLREGRQPSVGEALRSGMPYLL